MLRRGVPDRAGRLDCARGAVRPGFVVFLLIVIVVGYLAVVFVPAYWTYFSMLDPVKEAAIMAASPAGEEAARARLLREARQAGLALDEDAVEFVRLEAEQVVRVRWSVPVELPRYRYTLRFNIERRSLLP
jgi:hypothetical protein